MSSPYAQEDRYDAIEPRAAWHRLVALPRGLTRRSKGAGARRSSAGIILAAGGGRPLLVTGILLSTFFHQASLRRFDLGLADLAQGLLAGATVADGGAVQAPQLTDARALRVYSGRYWQIAEHRPGGAMRPLVRSRSLFDQELRIDREAWHASPTSGRGGLYATRARAQPLGRWQQVTLTGAATRDRLPARTDAIDSRGARLPS